MSEPVETKIDDIIVDYENIYPRETDPQKPPHKKVSWHRVLDYANAMRTGDKFPPIKIGYYNKQFYLIDGFHRLLANKQLKNTTIPAIIKEYSSKKQMFIDAVKENTKHGVRLRDFDIGRIILKSREYGLSENTIAKLVGKPKNCFITYINKVVTVNGIKRGLNNVLEDGLERNLVSIEEAEEIILTNKQKDLISRDTKHIFRQAILAIKSNLIDWENEYILELANELIELIQEKLTPKVVKT